MWVCEHKRIVEKIGENRDLFYFSPTVSTALCREYHSENHKFRSSLTYMTTSYIHIHCFLACLPTGRCWMITHRRRLRLHGTGPDRTGLYFVCMEPFKIDPGQVYTEPFCNRSGTDPTMDLQTRQVQFWIHSRLVPERFRVNRRQSGQIFAPGPSGASPVQTQPVQQSDLIGALFTRDCSGTGPKRIQN